jgi:hypothetical protein
MRYTLLLFCSLITASSFATNYYVSPAGSPTNSGLSVTLAKDNIEDAAQLTMPGDTVYILNGTYTKADSNDNVVNIYHSGTAGHWITYRAYPGHKPLIRSRNWCGINVQGADYIVIDGMTIIGYSDSVTLAYAQSQKLNTNNPITSGNGIFCAPEYSNQTNKPHHVTIRNCHVSKCPGGGIGTMQADYIHIENNVVTECCYYAPYGNSAISIYQNWNSDSTTGTKNYITGNTCYRNENYIPFYVAGVITDGNGIIVDDSRNTQNSSALGVYVGKTYITNNIVYDNGARGIHCYSSDHVIIANNTSYHNCQSPSTQEGEYTAFDASDIIFVNNIAYPDSGIRPIDTGSATVIIVHHNLWAANDTLALPYGQNTIHSPVAFVNPAINPALADFHLLAASGAINKGTRMYAPLVDYDGHPRLLTDSVDIGAYEYLAPVTGVEGLDAGTPTLAIYPNPAQDNLRITILDVDSTQVELALYDLSGRLIPISTSTYINRELTWDVHALSIGMYILHASTPIGIQCYKINILR